MKQAVLGLFGIVLGASCAPGVILYEPTPVVVSAARPAPAPRPVVRREFIDVKEKIFFETNLATIKNESLRTLDELATLINEHPELRRVRVEGHTDSVGSKSDNLSLSKRRALAVRTYLIERGVDARRLLAEGYGSEQPIASNGDETGRAKNRRVVFRVLDRVDDDRVVVGGNP